MSIMSEILDLRQKAAALSIQNEHIYNASNGNPSGADKETYDANFAEWQRIAARVKFLEQKQGFSSVGRLTDNAPIGDVHNSGFAPGQAGGRSPSIVAGLPGGFAHRGEFYRSVYDSSRVGGQVDRRLLSYRNDASSLSGEVSGEQGGYLVPPEQAQDIWRVASGEGSLLSLLNVVTTGSNTYIRPLDMRPSWDNSGGPAVYWGAEAAQYKQSQVDIKTNVEKLGKLYALLGISDELWEDYPSLDAYVTKTVGEKIDFAVRLAIVQGSGIAQPLGILNSPACVVVPKTSGQLAGTVTLENITSMWSNLLPGAESRSFWLAHKSVEPQLQGLYLPVMNSAGTDVVGAAGQPIYLPGNSIAGRPNSTLCGRPVIFSEACNRVGSVGDIILCDGQNYGVVVKSSGIQQAASISLWFDFGLTALRFVLRISGSPLPSGPIPSRDGLSSYGAFIALAQRA